MHQFEQYDRQEALTTTLVELNKQAYRDGYWRTLQYQPAEADPRQALLNTEFYNPEDGIIDTNLVPLDEVNGYMIYAKLEYLQRSGSFKDRGARRMVDTMLAREPGITDVTTFSAGNHAQGVARAVRAARNRGVDISGHIFTRSDMSAAKRESLEKLAAEGNVYLHADYASLEHAQRAALSASQQKNWKFVPPFDHLQIMLGQGTMFAEIIHNLAQDDPDVTDVNRATVTKTIGVGGGGALSGLFGQAVTLGSGNMRVVGVQQSDYLEAGRSADAFARELYAEPPLTPETLDTSCDGTAVRHAGRLCLQLLKDQVDVMRLQKGVVGAYMEQYAMGEFGERIEPAGALGLAGAYELAKRAPAPRDGRNHYIVGIVTGRNVSEETWQDYASTPKPLTAAPDNHVNLEDRTLHVVDGRSIGKA